MGPGTILINKSRERDRERERERISNSQKSYLHIVVRDVLNQISKDREIKNKIIYRKEKKKKGKKERGRKGKRKKMKNKQNLICILKLVIYHFCQLKSKDNKTLSNF